MNVITILCDTLRRDHCGPYHHGQSLSTVDHREQADWVVPTPNIDRLAAKGTTFNQCWCGSTPCMPARRDLYTGQYEFIRRGWGPLEDTDYDLPRMVSGEPNESIALMRQQGRPISYLVSDHFHLWEQGAENYHCGYSGFEFIRGFEADGWTTDLLEFDCPPSDRLLKTERHFRNKHFACRSPEEHFAAKTFRTASTWLERNHQHDNFYLHIDCFSPHEPWDAPDDWVKRFDPRGGLPETSGRVAYGPWENRYNADQVRNLQARYAASVSLTDHWFGLLLDTLDRLQLWDDTLIVFTTDHGTFNGDLGRLGKIQTHDHPSVSRLPFIVCHPHAGHGEQREQLVQLVDLYPTTLAALGLTPPQRRIDGHNLLPIVTDNAAIGREVAIGGMFGKSLMVTDGQTLLHQSPCTDNAPLNWYSSRASRFPSVKYELGTYEQGRRSVQNCSSWETPSWLTDLATDATGRHNAINEQPQAADRLRLAASVALQQADAPAEQGLRLELPIS